jgi:salicylate hydroxylase
VKREGRRVKPLEIAIAGAGPAGLSAALAVHRAGHRVTLFEQFETPRPLGSGIVLQPPGLAVLDWLGLGDRIRALGARIDRLYGRACDSNRVVLDVRYAALGELRGIAVHRGALFNVLLEAVTAGGIVIETGSRIEGLQGTTLTLEKGRRAGPFDLIVDASGARSPLMHLSAARVARNRLEYGAIWASLPWPGAPFDAHALEQRYLRAAVMIGVLPIGCQREGAELQPAFFWSLKTRDFAAWQSRGLDAWKDVVRGYWPQTAGLLDCIVRPEQMVQAIYDHHTLAKPYGEKIDFIGDSAHSTSPQLGQGANMALLDVQALAAALAAHADLSTALPAYAKARRFHVRLYQAMSLLFTPFYQSDSVVPPLARDYLVAMMARIPLVQKLLANIVAGKLGLQ